MGMLAEPKRRVKYSTDPRGNNWCNDENKFGQKLMEKFGWEKGKGLGASLSGETDAVSVKLKNDNLGLGFSKKNEDNWIAHQDDFAALLASLNQNCDTVSDNKKNTVTNLEQTTKNAKGKIYYKKFTRGKDLSKANEENMNSIFGKRKKKGKKEQSTLENVIKQPDISLEDQKDVENNKNGFITVTSSVSVGDYFAKKMAARNAAKNDMNKSSEESFIMKEKKKKKRKSETTIECSEISTVIVSSYELPESTNMNESYNSASESKIDGQKEKENLSDFNEFDSHSQIKKKKKRKSDLIIESSEVTNLLTSSCELSKSCQQIKENVTNFSDLNGFSDSQMVKEKKKKKNRKSEPTIECLEINNDLISASNLSNPTNVGMHSNFVTETKKRKKSNSSDIIFQNNFEKLSELNAAEKDIPLVKTKKMKNKKKSDAFMENSQIFDHFGSELKLTNSDSSFLMDLIDKHQKSLGMSIKPEKKSHNAKNFRKSKGSSVLQQQIISNDLEIIEKTKKERKGKKHLSKDDNENSKEGSHDEDVNHLSEESFPASKKRKLEDVPKSLKQTDCTTVDDKKNKNLKKAKLNRTEKRKLKRETRIVTVELLKDAVNNDVKYDFGFPCSNIVDIKGYPM